MSWMLLNVLPADVVAIIHGMATAPEPLCRCSECDRVLLVQDEEPFVRSNQTFHYRAAPCGALDVAVADEGRTAILRPPPSTPPSTPSSPRHVLELPSPHARWTWASHTCGGRTPVCFRYDGRTFANARPRFVLHTPFTRLDDRAVCLPCRAARARVRSGFETWKETARPTSSVAPSVRCSDSATVP